MWGSSTLNKWLGVDTNFLIKSSFWLNLEKAARMLSELGIIVMLTRLTDLKVVGQYELLLSIYSLVAVLAITGFNSSLLRALSTGYDGTLREVLRLSWRWSAVGAGVLVLGGWWSYEIYPTIGLSLIVAAPIFPWYTVLRRWDVVLQAKERFAERSAYYAVSSTGLLISVGAAIWWSRDNVAVPFIVLVAVQAMFNIIFFRRVNRLLVNDLVEEHWMRSGYKLFLSEIFNVLYSRLDRLVLVGWLGLEALAIYAIATKIGEGVKLVLGGVVSAYVPRLYKNGTLVVVQWYWAQGWKIVTLVVGGLLVGWLVTPVIIVSLFGEQYRQSVVYAQWYLLVIPFHLLASIWSYLLIKDRREGLFVGIGVIAGAANIVAYIMLIPKWGISGAVAGSIVYYVVLGCLYFGSVNWILRKDLVNKVLKI
jgi:O-antigen/teichoic acid export membrane protein